MEKNNAKKIIMLLFILILVICPEIVYSESYLKKLPETIRVKITNKEKNNPVNTGEIKEKFKRYLYDFKISGMK